MKTKKTFIKSYKDLLVWQKAHKLAMEIFRLFKQKRKTAATYEIWRQCLKSSFSTAANIVEGYYTRKGKTFGAKLEIAKGEAGETEYWLFVLSEIRDITKKQHQYFSKEY